MGRKLKTRLPVLKGNLMPQQPDHRVIRQTDDAAKAQYKAQYDLWYGARPFPTLKPGDSFFLVKLEEEKQWTNPGTVILVDPENRSDQVSTNSGTLRRNRRHLQMAPHIPSPHNEPVAELPLQPPSPEKTAVLPPDKPPETPPEESANNN